MSYNLIAANVEVVVRYSVKWFTFRLCVRVRLACSVGVRPTRVIIRSPVAWMAGRRETEYLKPIDKAILWGCERVTGP
jgi:hypothetical protein